MKAPFLNVIRIVLVLFFLLPAGCAGPGGQGGPSPAAGPAAKTGSLPVPFFPASAKIAPGGAGKAALPPEKSPPPEPSGPMVSIDVQNAEIAALFRLLSEAGGVNIALSPDVRGKVSLRLTDVPWHRALDTALEINGLGKKVSGPVITVYPLEALKRAEEEDRQRREAEGRAGQVSIEARIVEANRNFMEKLGVRWGYGYRDTWDGRDIGLLAGSAPEGTVTTFPGGIGVTDSNVAVNFPPVAGAAAPTLGLIAGSGRFVLDVALSALEAEGAGKILSSPRVTTLDGVKAVIGQGEEIPYVVRDRDGNYNVEMKNAKLELRVTPKITADGRICMKVEASNKYADWKRVNVNSENPPLVASNVESTVVLEDGDTIVLGGICRTTETTAESGVPWLSRIPVLGWLFKARTVVQDRKELLIFVTPRIVEGAKL